MVKDVRLPRVQTGRFRSKDLFLLLKKKEESLPLSRDGYDTKNTYRANERTHRKKIRLDRRIFHFLIRESILDLKI